SDEDRLKLHELMELCTDLQSNVLDLEKTKTTQALEITSLKRRLKKPEKKQRKPNRKDTQVPQLSVPTESVAYEAVYKELDDRLVRDATTSSSLEAEQDNDNIDKTQSKATPNEARSLGTTSGGGPRCQKAMGDTITQTRFENTKTTQALEITSLKRRLKKPEKKQRSRPHKLKRLYKVGLTPRVDPFEDKQSLSEDISKQGRKINDIDADEDITLVNDQDDAEMFDVNDLHGEEVFVEIEVADKEVNDEVQKVVEEVVEDTNTAKLIIDAAQVSAASKVNAASIATTDSAAATLTIDEITLAQALVEIKTSKPKANEIVSQEPSESITTTTISSKKSQDKGKAIMIEELVKPKKKVQLMLDEEAALKLQAEFDDEKRLSRENLDTISMDDLCNNFKVYEPEVKGMSSSNSNTQNMAFLSSTKSSTNGAVNTTNEVSTASTQVNAAFATNIDNLNDPVICAFLACQPNSPQLAHEDLEQIHPDDMEEMNLRWQMVMLTMRAKRNQDNEHKESTRRSVHVETPASTALVSCDGLGGYDWSDQAKEGPNYALMAYTSSSSDPKLSSIVSLFKKSRSIRKEVQHYDEEEKVSQPKVEKKTLRPSIVKKEFFKAKQQGKTARKTVKQVEHHRQNTHSLRDYKEIDGGYVAFEGNPKGGKITGKSVSQICDKKNSVLFNDTGCTVLSLNLKLNDESQVLLRVPRKNNMYSVDLKNIVTSVNFE
nr:hypothetical protein [Tanacetum cinerariifolium]